MVKKMEIEKILSMLLEVIQNKYFIIAIVITISIVILIDVIKYPAYKKDCKIFNQKPKPKGYIINTTFNCLQMSSLVFFAFSGFHVLSNMT